MFKKIMKVVMLLIGGAAGYGVSLLAISLVPTFHNYSIYVSVFLSILFAIIFYLLSDTIFTRLINVGDRVEIELRRFTSLDLILGLVGLLLGLVIAFLLSQLAMNIGIPVLGPVLSVIFYILFPYIGIIVTTRRKDISNIGEKFTQKSTVKKSKKKDTNLYKILDTSVIIDGRIKDIANSGFIEGTLVIPNFVLQELQHIADSADDQRRKRGRRGLDILKQMQNEAVVDIEVSNEKIDTVEEIDDKILELAAMMDAKVLTNDYNLNKVAQVRGIEVLNINELANAVKPVILPSEELVVEIVRAGKEKNQGLAYLSDGTMIVVEEAKKRIGEKLKVEITTVLQTAAGKMMFAKIKE